MPHREGVSRTGPRNRNFVGLCVFSGAEGICTAWQKRFVQNTDLPESLGPGPLRKGASPRIVECCRVAINGSS